MMNNKGFISVSIIYSFFLVFIAIVIGMVAMYVNRRILINTIEDKIRESFPIDCIDEGITELKECILFTNGGREYIESQETPDFTIVTSDGEYGMFSSTDYYGTSYYYRGDVINNYVQFGQNNDADDMYWRIVRINGDGTIRLIYEGTKTNNTNSDYIKELHQFNENYLGGYRYSQYYIDYSGSYAAQELDSWYENFLKADYGDYLSDSVFCNDREELNEEISRTYNEDAGADNRNILLDSYERLYLMSEEPRLTCASADILTVGNGKLDYPIGLITADEVSLAGGVYNNANENYYLYYNYPFWTMTAFDNSAYDKAGIQNGEADLWYVDVNGTLKNTDKVYNNLQGGLRPVINLKDTTKIKEGKGTIKSPFILEEVN